MPVEFNPYDSESLISLRKNQGDPFYLYLIVRKSLQMSPGKIATQVGHGVQMITLRYREIQNAGNLVRLAEGETLDDIQDKDKRMTLWLNSSFRKCVLVAKDSQWERIKNELWCFVVRDAGLTEVDPGSETVLVLWPMRKSERPKLIQRLQAL